MVIAEGESWAGRQLRQSETFKSEHGTQVSTFSLARRRSLPHLLRSRRQFKRMLHRDRPDVVHVRAGSVTALFTVLSSAPAGRRSFRRQGGGPGVGRERPTHHGLACAHAGRGVLRIRHHLRG
jgi:hypothetical protein